MVVQELEKPRVHYKNRLAEAELSYYTQLQDLVTTSRDILEISRPQPFRNVLSIKATKDGLAVSDDPESHWDNFPQLFNHLDGQVTDLVEIVVDFPIGHLESGLKEVDWNQLGGVLASEGMVVAAGTTNGYEHYNLVIPEMEAANIRTRTFSTSHLENQILKLPEYKEILFFNPQEISPGTPEDTLVLYVGEKV